MHKPSSSLGEASLASDQLLQPFFLGKKVLVTGSKGFVGRALCLRLRRLGAFVVGVDLVALPSCVPGGLLKPGVSGKGSARGGGGF